MDIREFFTKKKARRTGNSPIEPSQRRLPKNGFMNGRVEGVHICQYCNRDMKRRDALQRHLQRSTPCHHTHPKFERLCKYCNKWEFIGKTKTQSNDHRHYCKTRHKGLTYHERERQRLQEFESNEIKLLRERIEILSKKVEEPRNIIVHIDQVNIDKVYANMVPMVSSRMQALFNSSKNAIKYFDAWVDKREDLELLAKDRRTDSFQADTLSELALRIGANALHAADLSYLVDQNSGNITVTRDANGKRIEQTISLEEFQMKVNRTSLNSIGEIDYMDDFDDIIPSLSKKENNAMKEFAELEGIDHTILTEKSEGMIQNVLLKKKRYVESTM